MLPPATPDLIALDLLDSIAELGSLGQAASRHRMSQPAVSMRMSQLERRLGVVLLQRSPAGTRLTPAGERVATLARRVLSEAAAMMAGVAAVVAEESSHLRVAASLTVAEHLLPGWLAALHRESPEVILAVEVTNSAKVLARVRDGRADVGFVEGHETGLDGMTTVVVRSDHLVVVVDPAHPWAERQSPVTGPELAAAELIVREPGVGDPGGPGGCAALVRRAAFPAGAGLDRGDPGRRPPWRGPRGTERPGRRGGSGHRPPARRAHRRYFADPVAAGGMARGPATGPAGQAPAQRRGLLTQPPGYPAALAWPPS